MSLLISIKTIIGQVEGFIQKVFETYLVPAILFTEKVKAAIDSPIVDEIDSFIPGNFAKPVVLVLRDAVGIALEELLGLYKVESEPTPQARLQAFITFLKTQPEIIQSGIYTNLAASITNAALQANKSSGLPVYKMNAAVTVKYAELKGSGKVG